MWKVEDRYRKWTLRHYPRTPKLVIHQKRIFLCRTTTNIRHWCTAEYSAENNKSRQKKSAILNCCTGVHLLVYELAYEIACVNRPKTVRVTEREEKSAQQVENLPKVLSLQVGFAKGCRLNTTFVVVSRSCFCRFKPTCRPTIVGQIFGRQPQMQGHIMAKSEFRSTLVFATFTSMTALPSRSP